MIQSRTGDQGQDDDGALAASPGPNQDSQSPDPIMHDIVWRLLPPIGKRRALNLIYCLGFLRVAGQIEGAHAVDRAGTGRIHRQAAARAEATIQDFLTWFEHGPHNPQSAASLARVRRLHEHYRQSYSMSQETFVHTIAFFTVQFGVLLDLVGAPGFSDRDKDAQVRHWRGVGDRLGVTDMPTTWDGMLVAMHEFEADPARFGLTDAGRRCAEALIRQFAADSLPRSLRWLARPVLLSLTEPYVLANVGQQAPPAAVARVVRALTRVMLSRGG